MNVYGLSFRDALKEAAIYLGIEPNTYSRQLSHEAITLLRQSFEQGVSIEERTRLKELIKGFKHE